MPHGYLEISDEEYLKHLAVFLHQIGFRSEDLTDFLKYFQCLEKREVPQ